MFSKPLKTMLACICILACGALAAAPASWYQWRSKFDGTLACSQTPLGPGWEKARGPYQDSRCTKPALAK